MARREARRVKWWRQLLRMLGCLWVVGVGVEGARGGEDVVAAADGEAEAA